MSQTQELKAIMCKGVSASGKSTWAKQFVKDNPNWVIICRDDIRTDLMGGNLDWSKWNWKREGEVTAIQEQEILAAKKAGINIIIADTNLPVVKDGKPAFSNGDKLAQKLARLGYSVEWKMFDISLEEAISRDASRGKLAVGEQVIRRQYGLLQEANKL